MPFERCEFDDAYIERLVAGDPDTERHFVGYFSQLLTIKLRSRLRTAAQVEDAKQETFMRVLTTLKQKGGLAAAGSLGAFVNSVCNNVLFETYRSQARDAPLEDTYDEVDGRPAADATLIADQERESVRQALAALPERERDLLVWLFLEERDKDEICRELQVDRNYLRVLLHRTKNQFRERFREGRSLVKA